MTANKATRFAAIALVVVLALVNTMVIRTSNRAPDDAYISLRYADNLASGHGLRFNPGGDRVEGFSSPLNVLTMAAMIRMGFDPLAVSQFNSLSAALACIVVVAVWGQRKFGALWGSLSALALALSQSLSYWARGGLETTGFTLLILLAFIAAGERRWRTMGALAGLVTVMRPEGVLYLAPYFVFAICIHIREGRQLKNLIPAVFLALAPLVAWFLFRVAYFNDILPNTYYAKMDGTNLAQMQRGIKYAYSFLRLSENQVILILTGTGGIMYLVRTKRPHRDLLFSWPIMGLGIVACSLLFVLASGGDHMHQHRFILPVLPVLVLMAGRAGKYLSGGATSVGRSVVTAVLVLVFVSQPLRIFIHDLRHPHHPLDRPLGLVEPFDDYHICELYKLGLEMRKITGPGATFALGPVGAFPFAWGGMVIDMGGLNDREIARLPVQTMGQGKMGHEKGNGQIILARKPDFILIRNFANPEVEETALPEERDLRSTSRRQIWEDDSFHRDYEPFLVKIDENTSYTIHRRVAGR